MRPTKTARIPWWPLPVLLALAFFVFWPVLDLTPFSDDHSALWNAGVRGIPWRTGIVRPLADLSFRWGNDLWGTSTFGHRAFNVGVHGVNAFLLFALFMRLATRGGISKTHFGAWIAALLFLVYPFHQESIVWLVGRESALGTMFTLISLLALSNEQVEWRQVVIAWLAFFAGLLCYEGTVLLPFLAFPILYMRGSGLAYVGRVFLGFSAAMIAYFIIHFAAGTQVESSYFGGILSQPIAAYLTNIPKVGARLFLPPSEPSTMVFRGIVLGLVLITGAAFLWLYVRRKGREWRAIAFHISLQFTILALISSIQPILGGVSTRTSESDRFLYLPSVFLCMLIAILITKIPHRFVRLGVFMVLLAISSFAMHRNHANWRSASYTTTRVLAELPDPPPNGDLFVSGLPDNERGAFIFRNGFREAVWLSGRDGDRYIEVKDTTLTNTIVFRGERHIFAANDRWAIWKNGGFSAR